MLAAIFIWILKFILLSTVAIILISAVPTIVKAQTQHAGYVFTANSDSTFGWFTPYWSKYTDTGVYVMTFTRAKHSIDSLGTLINAKLLASNFTKSAMVALGMMAYTDSNAMLVPYAKTTALSAYKSITDSGRAISQYVTGAGLNKVKDSVVSLINAVRSDTVFTPSLNTGVRLSTTKSYLLNLYVTIGIASALVGNNQGNVTLQRSPDNATWVSVALSNNAMLGVLSTSSQTVTMCALLPAGYYYRLVTSSVGANTATFTAVQSNATIF